MPPEVFRAVFQGDLNGHRGLVPSNFLQAVPDDAAAGPPSAQPASEPKKESQVALSCFGHIDCACAAVY